MRAVVLADTHIPDGSGRSLDERVLAAVAEADVVLHAGDVTGPDLLDRLGASAPVHAVLGNNDGALARRLPTELALDLDGVRVALVHDAGPRAGRAARMARRFPGAALVVYGHSHLPEDLDPDTGPRLFNPGSPTQRRMAPTRSFGLLDVEAGRIIDLRHVPLTTTLRGFHSEIVIEPDAANGLEAVSAAQCQHLRAVSPGRILDVRGNVGSAALAQIRETIAVILDIP